MGTNYAEYDYWCSLPEIKNNENRVGMTHSGVQEMIKHVVYVQWVQISFLQ